MKLKDNKFLMLILSLLLDALGYVSFLIPGLGEYSDFIWAPMSAFIMTKLYKGKIGKIGATVAFVEEALPGLDVVPTFTIMWFYIYVIKNKKSAINEDIEV
jgi:hypothetical protein